MDIYESAKEYWETLPQGTEITVSEMMEKCSAESATKEIRNKASKNISSFFCKQVKIGKARKFSLNNIANIYTKLDYPIICKTITDPGIYKSIKVFSEPNPLKETFNELKLGKAILAIIDNLKNEIASLKDQQQMMVQEIKTMRIAYQQAQGKIIELNQKLNNKKPIRSFKLEDLQNVVNRK